MTLDERLKIIEERAEKASKGPWQFVDGKQDGPSDKVVFAPVRTGLTEEDESHNEVCTIPNDSYAYACNFDHNGEFIAASREDVPALVRVVKKLREQRDRYIELHLENHWGRPKLSAEIKSRVTENDAEAATEWEGK